MIFEPDFDRLSAAFAAGRPQVVWARLVADLETPVSAYLKLAEGEKYSFLLESVEGGERIGRYTYIGRDPFSSCTYSIGGCSA